MTGSNSFWFAKSDTGFYNSVATQSLRFEDGDSPVLTRTPSSDGNKRTWTWSCWFKMANIIDTSGNVESTLMSVDNSASGKYTILGWYQDSLYAQLAGSGQVTAQYDGARVRDTTGWYHVVWAVDTTQSTSGNRSKVYLNGTQLSFATDNAFPQNTDTDVNDTNYAMEIGDTADYARHFDGYMAEINFIDGSQLAPTSFGETKEGVWIPINTSGLTFGTNGYRLQFKETGTGTASTSTIGADTSGNTNHFTSSNLASTDSNLPDCPEDNYPTMNPLHKGVDAITFTEGNLKSSFTSDVDDTHHGCTFALPKEGKWYWEQTFTGANTGGSQAPYCGIYDSDTLALGISDNFINSSGDFITYYTHNNAIYINGSNTNYTGSIGNQSGAVVGFAVDMDDGHLWVHVNGTYINGTPTFSDGTNKVASPNTDSTYIPFWSGNGGGVMTWEANFGQASFTGTKPDGYSLLTSANLPEPTLGPNSDEQPDDHFNIITWTGNDSTRTLTGVNFQPDLVWIKTRNQGNEHTLFDSSRGVEKHLESDSNGTETTQEQYGYVSAFAADGFTVVTGSSGYHLVNHSSNTFVAWNWKANGGTTTTNDASSTGVGTIDSVHQANTTAGFSIVTYTGTGSDGTYAHGLSSAPTLIFIADRDATANWLAYHHESNATKGRYFTNLNLAVAQFDNGADGYFKGTAPSSTLITTDDTSYNTSGNKFVAYCWHDVENYSKFNTYIGNGSADGPYVHLGFSPSLVALKRADSTGDWNVIDTTRQKFNDASGLPVLRWNLNAVEEDTNSMQGQIDVLSNGFKVRSNHSSFNASGATVQYMAWAKIPDKYSNAF